MPSLTRRGRVALARATRGLDFEFGDVPILGRKGGFGPKLRFGVSTDGLDKAIAELAKVGVIAEQVADQVIGEETHRAADRIAGAWPVDTGLSSSRWSAGKVRVGKVMRWLVMNDVPYARYVHRKGETTPLVESLVQDEIGSARKRIRQRLKRLIKDRLAKLTRGDPRMSTITRAGRAILRR